ncbi:MAG: hypothetical protein V1929_09950 [bacterium]
MEITDRLQLLSALNESARKEAELMWTRFQAMLFASTGLIAILAFALEKQLLWLIYATSILGIVFAVVWIQIMRLSRYYYDRWQLDADALVRSDDELREWVRGRIDPRLSKPTRPRATTYAAALPVAFLIGWIVVFVAAAGGVLQNPIQNGGANIQVEGIRR